MWTRGVQRRFDSSDGRSLGIIVPCGGRGLKGRVFSLVSSCGPVSGAGFDQERRVLLDEVSTLLVDYLHGRFGL